MIKTKFILSILLVLATIKTECGEGCLKCDNLRNKCIFCDPKENYKTMRGNCVKTKNENCAISSLDGNCLHCKESYFLDLYTYKCVEIPKEGTIANCSEYSGNNRCSKCLDSFFLNRDNECMEISSPISNCEVYKTSDQCVLCEKGFLLGVDYKTCAEPTQLENCSSYTQLKCISCNSGYTQNENNFIYELLGFYNKKNIRNLEQRFITDTGINLNSCRSDTCQRLYVENCSVYASFDECLTCLPGFFVEKGKCVGYPEEKIPFCLTYSALEVCTSCEKKMYLKSEKECVEVENVENCSIYDTSAIVTSCKECFSTHFLSEPNICTKRSVESNIADCTQLFIDQERCQICAENFISTDDRKACLPIVKNCQTYISSSIDTGELECDTCIEGYYYDSDTKLCVQGGKEFCKIYSKDSNECDICENRYYKSSGECIPHEDLVYCEVYSNDLKDACTDCNDKTQRFERINTCLRVEEIQFCDVYASKTSCKICLDGYFLNGQAKCEIIPGEEFCLQKDGVNCVKCLQNYILENGSCREPLFHLMKNCDSHTVNGTNNFSQLKCNYCRENTVPLDFKESFVCYEEDYIENQLGVTLVDNCLKYKLFGSNYKCVSCDKETVLEDGECVEECFDTLRSHVIQYFKSDGSSTWDNIYIEKNRECGTKVPHCLEASPDLSQDFNNFTYSCVVCEDDTISQVKFDDRRVLVRPPHEINKNTDFSPLSYNPSRNCIPISDASTKIIGDLSNNRTSVPFCDLYYDLDIGYGCIKCMRGYTGEVVDVIYQCELYENLTTCKKCNQGYYLKANYLCVKVSPVLNCSEYGSESVDECKLCQKGFYLNSPTNCEKRISSIINCNVYEFDSLDCKLCETGFIATGSACVKKIVRCLPDFHSVVSGSAICDKCQEGYYRFDDKCMPGTILYCLEYQLDLVDTCKLCVQGKFLKNNICVSQTPIGNCDDYSQIEGYCNKCSDTFFLLENKKKCKAVIDIVNCEEWHSINLCKRCITGSYTANFGKKCLTIPTEWNCAEWGEFPAKNECIKCNPTFVLYEGTCHNWFIVQMFFCSILDQENDPKKHYKQCKYCKDATNTDTIQGLDLNKIGICMEKDFFKYLKEKKNYGDDNLYIPENCERYEYLNTVLICKRCSDGFYVLVQTNLNGNDYTKCVTQKECTQNTNYYPAYTNLELFNTDLVKIKFGPSCVNIPANSFNLENCYLSPILNSSTTVSYRCTRCFDGYISIVNLKNEISLKSIGFYDHEMFGDKTHYRINYSTPVIDKCVKAIEMDISGKNLDSYNELKGCKHYYEYKTDLYGCLTCEFNKTGIIKPDSITAPDHGYIDTCDVLIAKCYPNELKHMRSLYHPDLFKYTLNGFDLGILFTSCQKCEAEYIVVANVSAGDTVYKKITGLSNGSSATPVTDKLANECVLITITNVIENCSYAIRNIPIGGETAADPPGTTLTGTDLYCVACAPGFRPIPAEITAGAFIGLVGECVAIENCDLTTNSAIGDNANNICTTCDQTGVKKYAWLYNEAEKRIRYDYCSETINDNCIAVTSSQVCMFCKDGFVLKNGECLKNKPYLVKNQSLNQDVTESISISDLQTLFYLFPEPVGTDECATTEYFPIINYNGLFENPIINIPTIDKICSLVQNSAGSTLNMPDYVNSTEGNLVDNCESTVDFINYKFNLLQNDRVDCANCATDYIRSNDGKCILAADFPNCKMGVGLNSSFCKTCDTNYVAVAGICLLLVPGDYNQRPVIDCEEFDEAAFVTHIKCNKCKDGTIMETSTVDNKITYTCVAPGDNLVLNCAQYNSDNENHIFCVECVHNFSLMILKNDSVDLGAGLEPGYNRFCLDITAVADVNCTSYDKSKLKLGKMECENCKPQFILSDKVENLNTCIQQFNTPITDCASYDLDTSLVNKLTDIHYNPNLSTFSCDSCVSGNYLKQIASSKYECETRSNMASYSGNCKEFEAYSDSCKVCQPNFILDIDNNTCEPAITTTKRGSILNCAPMQTCNVEVKFDGLHPHLESVVSCHQCRDPTQIPFVAIAGDQSFTKIEGIGKYGINSSDEYKDLDGGKSVFCEVPNFAKFGHADTLNFNFPDFCAIGVMNVNSAKDSSFSNVFDPLVDKIDRTKVAVFCGACQPGYKAIYNVDATDVSVDFVITKCELIDNCIQKNAFNYCTKCAVGYSFEYAENKVNFDSCVVDNSNPSCYAYDTLNSKCKLCNKGTYLNKDYYCESINPPRCEYNLFNFRSNYDLDTFNVGLFLNNEGIGCNKCKDGYKAIFEPNHYFICTESEVHSEDGLTLNTQYINNCKNYYVFNNLLRCQTCHEGFVPLEATAICTPIGPIANCSLALTATTCSKCVDGFVTVNRLCVEQSIENCLDYLHDPTYQEQRCAECVEGYYMLANYTCGKGDVKDCLIFETKTVCNKCKDNFQLVTRSEGISYCFPIDQRLNCKQFKRNQFQMGNLECSECINNLYVQNYSPDNFFKTHCMKYSEVPNCVQYDIKPSNADSSFKCQKCTPNFFLTNFNTCNLRTVKPENCKEYILNEDRCLNCEDGYYLLNGSECKVFPTGVAYCRLYSDSKTCISCIENKYLSENNCLEVPEERFIENCNYYVAPAICEECAPNHILREGTCVLIQALNCKTLETVTSCGSCQEKFGFKEENGIKSCVQVNQPNCLINENEDPYNCVTCDDKSFVSDGICTPIVEEILGCMIYGSETTCNKCNSSMALALDQKSCVSTANVTENIDRNCSETQVIEKAVCNTCNVGYVFVNGLCSACETDNSRCYSCDPKALDVCLLCQSGYFMNIDLACIHPSEVPQEGGDTDNEPVVENSKGNPEEVTTEFEMVMVIKLLMMFYYML